MWTVRRRSDRTAVAAPAIAYAVGPGDQHVIAAACTRLGLELSAVVREHEDAADRPELDRMLDAMSAEQSACLVVQGLDRLADDISGLGVVLDRVEAGGIRLVALDIGLDTAGPSGRAALARRVRSVAPWVEPGAEPEIEPDGEAAPDREVAPETVPALTTASVGLMPKAAILAIGYASASGPKAAGALAAQRDAIARYCGDGDDLDLLEFVGDRESKDGKSFDRPGLSRALQRIAAGEAACLVVTELAHLSHSVAELGQLVGWLVRVDVRLVAIDLDLDTATEGGRTTARALAAVGDWDRERLSERTRAGLAAAREKRHAGTGTGARETATLHQRIAAMRADGMTLQAIADALNAEGVPTQRGGTEWRPSSVQSAAGYKRPAHGRAADRLTIPPDVR